MSYNKDYMPRNVLAFIAFFKGIINYVDANKTAWSHIPALVITKLKALLDDLEIASDTAAAQRTPAHTLARNNAQAAATKALRLFVNQYLRFDPVTDVDLVEMGIPVRDRIPTTVPPPRIPVEGVLSFPAAGLVEMREIRGVGTPLDKRADHGVRIYFGIVGTPSESDKFRISDRPKTGDDLPHSVFTRKKTHRFDFAKDSGKEVFFCMRFENQKGDAGPWGTIISAFIP